MHAALLLLLLLFTSSIDGLCNFSSEWFNENHPWELSSNGHDIERFSLIRVKYSSIFEVHRWTGSFEIRSAPNQQTTNSTMLIRNYTEISDGFICHAINGNRCVDYEIRFCLEDNPCRIPIYHSDESSILGSTEARPNSFPWHVSIQYENRHICAGTLIDDQHVLTAAQCFQHTFIPIGYTVVLGAHHLSNATRSVPINSLIIHSDYNSVTLENDIGLIRLSERIEPYSESIAPICLARSIRQPYTSNSLLVAGWRTLNNGTWSIGETDELRQTKLTLMGECSRVYKSYDFQKQICAGNEDSEGELCPGDIGGALLEKQKYDVDRLILTGIVSYGCRNVSQGYPGVYTRISAYYDWIQNNIENLEG